MPEFTPTLKIGSQAPLTACAWLLPTPRCDDWLEEIARWNVDHERLRFIAIPASRADAGVAGVLVVVEGGGGSGNVEVGARAIAYGEIAKRVYGPVESEVFPLLAPPELAEILAGDYEYVWHPGIGLIAAESKDIYAAADLLAPLRKGQRRWSSAVPGVAIVERLSMLAPQVELSFQQLLEEARGDIGTESEGLSDLPRSPDEPGNGMLDKLGRAAAVGIGGALMGLGKLLPTGQGGAGSGAGSRMFEKLREMLSGPMNRAMKVQEHLRHKEISRLLNMLEQNPDLGLKFALPLNAMDHRGLAAPSNRLGMRQVDFSLGRLGGGTAADFWDIQANYRQQLVKKYRELANREMHLGRHRRAAYIFAELLGDLESAAMALKNGHHYREAAIIYRDRLKRPLEAAKCLENGGLWSEAITEYENLRMHEHVGDLYTRIGDAEKAREAYGLAAGRLSSENDYLGAARIWSEKLGDAEQAIAALRSGWPHSAQAMECARALFAFFGRTGRHLAAAEQIDEIVAQCPESKQYARSADLLAEVASGVYPDVVVRTRAGSALQQVVSGRLRVAQRAEATLLVTALAKLAPDDRLLERDGRRYVAELDKATPPPLKLLAHRKPLRKAHHVNIGLSGSWQAATVVDKALYAAGIVDNTVVLARCSLASFKKEAFAVPWRGMKTPTDARVGIVGSAGGRNMLGVYVVNEAPLPGRVAFPRTDEFPEEITAGSIVGSSSLGMAIGKRHGIFAINHDWKSPAVVLQMYSGEGDLVVSHDVPVAESLDWENARFPLPVVARREHLYLAVGRTLLAWRVFNQDHELHEFSQPIRSLVASVEHTRARMVVGLEQGACMMWDPAADGQRVPFALDLHAPQVGINQGGYVIAAADKCVEVFDSKDGKLSFVGRDETLPAEPIAVLCDARLDRFAILTVAGDVVLYEV